MSGQEQPTEIQPFTVNFVAEIDRLGLSTTEAARLLQVGERQITRWKGGQEPRLSSVRQIAAALGRDVEWLLSDHSAERQAA